MLRIGEFSKMAKTTISTLRYYDKIGLLKPEYIDESTGYRYYNESQLSDIVKILELKDLGVSLEDTQYIVDGGEFSDILKRRRENIELEIKKLNKQRQILDKLIENTQTHTYKAVLKTIPDQMVFYSRGVIEDYSKIHSFIVSKLEEFKKNNPDIKYAQPDYCCTIYPEDTFRKEYVMIEYAQGVECAGVKSETVDFKTLEGCTVVSVEHYGDDVDLRKAYSFAVSWALENGYKICGSARERYINGKWNRENVNEWLTEIQIPVSEN